MSVGLTASLWLLPKRIFTGKTDTFALLQSLLTQFSILAVNLATGVMTARMLGPEGRGIFAAIVLWPQLLSALAVSGLMDTTSYYVAKNPTRRGAVVTGALLISLSFSIVAVVAAYFVIPHMLSKYPADVLFVAQLVALAAIPTTIQIIVNSTLIGLKLFGLQNLCRLLPQLFYMVGLAMAFAVMDFDYETAVAAQIVGGVMALLVMLPFVVPHLRGGLVELRSTATSMASFMLRAAPNDLLKTLGAFFDRLLLVPLISAAALGNYAVAFSLSRALVLIMPAVTGILLSKMTRCQPAEAKQHHDRVLRFLILGMVPLCVVTMYISKPMLTFVYGAEFERTATLFRILLADAALTCFALIAQQLYTALGRPGTTSTIQIVSFGLVVTLLLVLTPMFGAEGAAWALLITSAVRFLLLIGGMRFILRIGFPRLQPGADDIVYLKNRLMML